MTTQLINQNTVCEQNWDFEFQQHLSQKPSNFVHLLDKDSELRALYEKAIKRIKQVDQMVGSH